MAKISRKERFYSSIGMLLHILFVAGPLDFWYWIRSSLKSVNGRTVVITGGASGIGKRLAELFAIRFGAKVAILDINQVSRHFIAFEQTRRMKFFGGENFFPYHYHYCYTYLKLKWQLKRCRSNKFVFMKFLTDMVLVEVLT